MEAATCRLIVSFVVVATVTSFDGVTRAQQSTGGSVHIQGGEGHISFVFNTFGQRQVALVNRGTTVKPGTRQSRRRPRRLYIDQEWLFGGKLNFLDTRKTLRFKKGGVLVLGEGAKQLTVSARGISARWRVGARIDATKASPGVVIALQLRDRPKAPLHVMLPLGGRCDVYVRSKLWRTWGGSGKLPLRPLKTSRTVSIDAANGWENTGFRVVPGDTLVIDFVRGTWNVWPKKKPNTTGAGLGQLAGQGYPMPSANWGEMLGYVSSPEKPFRIRGSATFSVKAAGHLYMGINDKGLSDNTGTLDYRITHERTLGCKKLTIRGDTNRSPQRPGKPASYGWKDLWRCESRSRLYKSVEYNACLANLKKCSTWRTRRWSQRGGSGLRKPGDLVREEVRWPEEGETGRGKCECVLE